MEFRPLADDAEVERAWQMLCRSFGWRVADIDRFRDAVDLERTRVAVVGDEVVAFSRARRFGQFFGGRSVPLAGLSHVGVAPEHRGRGLGAGVTAAHFDAMRDGGEVLAGLYPASTGLYRSVGFGLGGVWGRRAVATRSLRMLPRADDVAVRRGSLDDVPAVKRGYRRVAPLFDGWLDREAVWWRRVLEDGFDDHHVYVVDGRGGELAGYVLFDQRQMPSGWGHTVIVHEVVYERPEVGAALWRLLGAMSSQAETAELLGPPEHPLLLVLPEQDLQPVSELRWMTRIVDLTGAMAARGFRPGVTVAVDLEVSDASCPWNAGRWRLTVEAGAGRAAPGGSGDVRLGVGALSSLYTGYATAAGLRGAGLLAGGSEATDSALDAAFAGPTPWCVDFY